MNNSLEVISQAYLPCIGLAAVAEHLLESCASCVRNGNVAGLAASDVIVGRHLKVAEDGEAKTYVNAEVGRLEFPFCCVLENRLVLVAYVEAELRTCEEEDVSYATETYAIA